MVLLLKSKYGLALFVRLSIPTWCKNFYVGIAIVISAFYVTNMILLGEEIEACMCTYLFTIRKKCAAFETDFIKGETK